MENCDGNFEIKKVMDGATTIEVKVESHTLSTTKDFILAMATMLVSYYVLPFHAEGRHEKVKCCLCIKNFWCDVFHVKVFVRGG